MHGTMYLKEEENILSRSDRCGKKNSVATTVAAKVQSSDVIAQRSLEERENFICLCSSS